MLGNSTPSRYERNKITKREGETDYEAYARTVRQRTFRLLQAWSGPDTEDDRIARHARAARRRERELERWI